MTLRSYFRKIIERLPYTAMVDRIFIFIMFIYAQKRIPRQASGLFNDYIYFLKNSPRIMDIFRQMTSDKILVKEFVSHKCGDDVVLDTIGIFYSVDDIALSSLKIPCVIKPAHGSGAVVFIKSNRISLSDGEVKTLELALAMSPYTTNREANYKHLRRRLICEPMLPDAESTKDYKVFCFNGSPRIIQVDSTRHTDHKRNLYDTKWNPLDISYNFPQAKLEVKPKRFMEMLDISKTLSQFFEFVRIDFFVDDERLFVGEITHCPESAHGRFGSLSQEREFSKILFSSDYGKK